MIPLAPLELQPGVSDDQVISLLFHPCRVKDVLQWEFEKWKGLVCMQNNSIMM